jgi:glucose/mannose transport system permease protein
MTAAHSTQSPERQSFRARLAAAMPALVLGPSLIATFVYVFVFTAWTLYISLSNSSLLPTYDLVGLKNY